MTTTYKIDHAYAAGVEAFKNGAPRIPVIGLIKDELVGGTTASLATSWLKGYDSANLKG